jgi:glucosamine-6-phosphate deaminase
MEIIIRPNAEAAAELAARVLARAIQEKPQAVLGLATGRTMERVYDYLVEMHERDDLDFALCRSFNLDEYVGLPADSEHSYRHYMNERLFKRVNIDVRNTHLPDGMAQDYAEESERYEKLIRESGGIDVQLLGMGRDGHIGFNEPLSALQSRTREKALTPTTIEQNAGMFGGDRDAVPRRAITMGVGTILESRRCLGLVTGEEKAEVVARALEGPITSMVSASALQLHPHCTVIVDEAASSRLEGSEYYRWIFENEPEWREFREDDS